MKDGADAQNVPIVEALLYDEQLQFCLARQGRMLDALVLRVLGHHHQAWDMSHLTNPIRTYRMLNLLALLRTCVMPKLNDVFEMANFGSNAGTKLLGLTTQLQSVMMANIEARMQLHMHFPAAAALLVERSLSTDDIECEFSTIVTSCGYKPTVEMLLSILEHITFFTCCVDANMLWASCCPRAASLSIHTILQHYAIIMHGMMGNLCVVLVGTRYSVCCTECATRPETRHSRSHVPQTHQVIIFGHGDLLFVVILRLNVEYDDVTIHRRSSDKCSSAAVCAFLSH